MDNLKKTETIIGLVNTAALLGAIVYFYKKINNLELELNKHSEHLTSTVVKVKDIANTKKFLAQLGNAMKELNGMIGVDRKNIESLKQIILYQSAQISELHSVIQTLVKNINENKESEESSDLSVNITKADNPYLQH